MNETTIIGFLIDYVKDVEHVDNLIFMAVILWLLYRLGLIKFKGILGSQITRNGLQPSNTGIHPKAPAPRKGELVLSHTEEMFDKKCKPRFDAIDKRFGNGDANFETIQQDMRLIFSKLAAWQTAWQIIGAHILRQNPDIVLDKKSKELLNVN